MRRIGAFTRIIACGLVLSVSKADSSTIDFVHTEHSADDDAFWKALLALPLAKFVVVVAAGTVVVKSVLATAGNRKAQELGVASVMVGPVNLQLADFEIDHQNSGNSGLPSGHAEALVEEAGHVRFTSDPTSLGLATITATVSPESSGRFEVSSGANPAFESASAFVGATFGIGNPNNLLNFLGAPLFSFRREVGDNGTLTGSIAEASFTFTLSPGESIDFVGTFGIGGQATTIPEPSTLLLFSSVLFIAVVARSWLRLWPSYRA